jgi:hypothetical protein
MVKRQANLKKSGELVLKEVEGMKIKNYYDCIIPQGIRTAITQGNYLNS